MGTDSNLLSKFRNRARVGLCTCRSAYAESLKLSGDRYVCLRCLTLYPCRKPLLYVSERVSETQPSAPFLTRHPSASATSRISQTIGGQIRLFAMNNTVSASEAPAVRVGARVGARSS